MKEKAFPSRFMERMQKILPEKERADFFEKCTEPLPKTIRNNQFSPEIGVPHDDWVLKKTAIPEMFFIERADQKTIPLGKTLEHFTGEIYIQSLSSALPVVILDPKPEEKILDLCAAPGSKTTFLAQKMQNTGLIVANEPSSSRSKKLAANLDRMGVLNTVMVQSDGTALNQYYAQEFDKILLDAPCSSEGFGRKDSQFFTKMWSERKIFEAAKLQKKLIISAFEMCCPGGEMVYSTCTSAPEENECVVQFLLENFPESIEIIKVDLNLLGIPHHRGIKIWENQKISAEISEKCARIYPHLQNEIWNSESFFVCKIKKKQAIKKEPPKKFRNLPLKTEDFSVLKKNYHAEVITRIAKKFGVSKRWPEQIAFWTPMENMTEPKKFVLAKKEENLFLTTPMVADFCKKNLYRRAGLKIQDQSGNLTTEFAVKFGKFVGKNFIELSETEKNRWLEGYDLEVPISRLETESSEILIKHKNFCLGWGKIITGRADEKETRKIKNKLDRDWIN